MRSPILLSSLAWCYSAALVLSSYYSSSRADAFSSYSTSPFTSVVNGRYSAEVAHQQPHRWASSIRISTPLFMQPSKKSSSASKVLGKERSLDLAAFAESASYGESNGSGNTRRSIRGPTQRSRGTSSSSSFSTIPEASFLEQFLLPVLSTAMLITGNTVGASMLVLPELAAGPGMAISSGVLVGAYMMNWLSGLCIAQVAIRQHETSGDEVPSSFKEFAQANLFASAGAIVSGISIFVNSLVLAFDTTKAGQVLSTLDMPSSLGGVMGGDSTTTMMVFAWATLMLGLVSTQSLARLSQVASVLVVGVFVTFAGLLLPGLAQVPDPLAVLTSGPAITMEGEPQVDLMASVLHMAPVFVTTLVYQNIVPTVTRILEYDRTKVVSAITLGSILPLFIYEAWCVAVLGGGIATTSSDLFTLFSIVTVAGSSMGALMSLSEEFEILLGNKGENKKDTFSFASVALPSIVGLGVCQLFADDISGALQVAGSYGSPLLYGLIPVSMAYLQLKRQPLSPSPSSSPSGGSASTAAPATTARSSVVPGGMAGLGALGLGATALVGSELTAAVSQLAGSH